MQGAKASSSRREQAARPQGRGRALAQSTGCETPAVMQRSFFDRPAQEVAPALIGVLLVHDDVVGRIVETEAYAANGDPAAHASRGRTARTEVLFGEPGRAYVFRTRQYHCLNVAVQEPGIPGCVLIRALEPVAGVEVMRARRGRVADAHLTDGPAKLCRALDVDMRCYGVDLCDGHGLHLSPGLEERANVVSGPRVGITVARDRMWRFADPGSRFVSRPRLQVKRRQERLEQGPRCNSAADQDALPPSKFGEGTCGGGPCGKDTMQ